ncbi:MAG: hypothetical protein ACLTXR_02130 [Clostridia bacterium]
MSEKDKKKAMQVTESDNQYINQYKDERPDTTQEIYEKAYGKELVNDDYTDSTDQ